MNIYSGCVGRFLYWASAPPPDTHKKEGIHMMNIGFTVSTLCTDGNLYKVIKYASGNRVKLPINADGSIKWFDDNKLLKNN